MKIQIVVLVLACVVVSISGMIGDKCWSSDDCSSRECCAGVSRKDPGACAFEPRSGQKCYPWLLPSSKTHCRCIVGTSCSKIYDGTNSMDRKYKFRCVKIVIEPDEIEAEQF